MALFQVLYVLLFLFWLLLISRVIVEFIRSFARDWHPRGAVAVILEVIFTITDPPVKLLRRLIPPVNLGGIRLDLSIMVLLFIVFILMTITNRLGQPVAPV
ncbi:YggT family protein [Nocardia transvalensis]|uniref:YggT family protein n=1 Tax=Nocardia transvalensis TaxID=37333 RepID=UPI0018932700|nr:YggT family protein [Nocardia transvalensis]MBF6330154.1 YggT family protein [Nocardia transvalensis]